MHNLLAKAKGLHSKARNHEVVALLGLFSESECMPAEEEAMFRCYVGSASWKLDQMLLANSQFMKAYRMLPLVTTSEYGCWIEICQAFRLGEVGANLEAESILAGAYFKYEMPASQRAHILRLWGQQAWLLGRFAHAEDLLSRSLAIYEETGEKGELAVTGTILAECNIGTGEYLRAAVALDRVESGITELTGRALSHFWCSRAEALFGLSDQHGAENAAEAAYAVAVGSSLPAVLAKACCTYAKVLLSVDVERARVFARQAKEYGLSARNGALVGSAMDML